MSASETCLCSPDCTCGACLGLRDSTPVVIYNRPGLSSIRYRIGDHARFKESLLTSVSRARMPALRGLTTRRDDDFSIVLLDAFSVVCDQFTFYQERLMNERLVRTATERLSVGYIAKMIGYELSPGCAANVSLAFRMMEAPGLPKNAPGLVQTLLLPIGTRVQSTPGQDEKPQVFETIEELELRVAWNGVQAASMQDQKLTADLTELVFKGSALNLRAGDGLLVVFQIAGETAFTAVHRRIQRVESDARADRTRAILQTSTGYPTGKFDGLSVSQTGVFVFRRQASLFGYNAPDYHMLPKDSLAMNAGEKSGAQEEIATQGAIEGLEEIGDQAEIGVTLVSDWDESLAGNSEGLLFLDSVYGEIVPGGWAVWDRTDASSGPVVLLVEPFGEKGFSGFGLSGKGTRLKVVKGENVSAKIKPTSFTLLRSTTVLVQSERLELAQVSVPFPVAGAAIELAEAVEGLNPGRRVAVSGRRVTGPDSAVADVETAELAVVASVNEEGRLLTLKEPLMGSYHPPSVRVNANVVMATHGETVQEEVLEGGDATRTFQRFALRQTPITYVSAAGGGISSTLHVWVEDVEWHEVRSFYGRGPKEQVFITRSDGDGKTWLQFGDGVTAARLPSGPRNVRVKARKGIGVQANLEAGRINLLMSRPLGLKDVVNPLPSTDGKDPESLEDARSNAPLAVLTLDRVVSLQDHEDYARAFGSVAKAAATWTWFGDTRGIFITVAGSEGGALSIESRRQLAGSIAAWGDPHVAVRVENYMPLTFRVGLRVKVLPDREAQTVLESVEVALRRAFSFARRSFGQDVTAAEVMAVAQAAAGVSAVQVAILHLTDDPDTGAGLTAPLQVCVPLPGQRGSVAPGELLTLDPAPLELLEEIK